MTEEELRQRLEDIERQISDSVLALDSLLNDMHQHKSAWEDLLQSRELPEFWRISRRLRNILARQGIYHASDIANRTQAQMENTPGIGQASMRELKRLMAERGLTFAERPIA